LQFHRTEESYIQDMSSTSNPVPRIYRAVIEDVIKNVRESFLNESVDEQVLAELKQLWENKLLQSRAIDFMPTDVNVRVSLTYPHNTQQNTRGKNANTTQSTSQSQQQGQRATTQHVVSNPAGQLVYVSSHPTLGNVGNISGAAAQAAMAIQNNPHTSVTLANQRLPPGVQQTQVIHVQGNPQQQSSVFPSFHSARGPGGTPARVIFSPGQVQQQHNQQQQQQQQKVQIKQQVIQVDGSIDIEEDNNLLENKNLLPSSSNLHKRKKLKTISKPSMKGEITCNNGDMILQLDGGNDSSSDDLDDEDDEEDFDNIPIAAVGGGGPGGAAGGGAMGDEEDDDGVEEEPLNSEDDVSDDDPTDLFDTDNVVVCQYDKIARTRNRWKFHLKDGIMNLNSKDYVFHKANGDSEW